MTCHLQPRDKWIPRYFFVFFAVIALVNGVMITLALRSYTGTVIDHPYERGLAYNQVVAAQMEQAARGWSSEIAYSSHQLQFTLRDRNGQRLLPEKATAYIRRPAQKGLDFTVKLIGEHTPLSFPQSGQWDVRIEAELRGVPYQKSHRVIVP